MANILQVSQNRVRPHRVARSACGMAAPAFTSSFYMGTQDPRNLPPHTRKAICIHRIEGNARHEKIGADDNPRSLGITRVADGMAQTVRQDLRLAARNRDFPY